MITRRNPIARSTKPIPRRRATLRRGPMRCPEYRAWLREEGFCAVCWPKHSPRTGSMLKPCIDTCDPCHTENGGMRMKGPDSGCAPLCRVHHDQYDGRAKLPNGEVGRAAFEAYYGVKMAD